MFFVPDWLDGALAALRARLRPQDLSTPEGRSVERLRRAGFTALASGVAQGTALIVSFAVVPLALNYLGQERYGVWLTLTSLIAFLGFADLGLGNGLVTAVAQAHGEDDRRLISSYTSSAFFLLSGVAFLVGLLFAVVYPHVDWAGALNVHSQGAVSEVGPGLVVLVVILLLNIPMAVTPRLQGGLQEGYISGMWQTAGSVMGLGALLVAIHLELTLPWLILAVVGTRLLAVFLNGAVTFTRTHPGMRPSVRRVSRKHTFRLAKLGGLFFGLQIAMTLAFASDNIIVARVLGPAEVPQLAIPFKLFSAVPSVAAMFLMPLWPAYGEAIARGDSEWVRSTLRRSLTGAAVVSSAVAVVLVVFGGQIIRFWVGNDVRPTLSLLLGLGAWMVLGTVGNAFAMVLNGAGIIRFQLVVASLMAISALAAKLFLVRTMGVAGVIWATVAAYAIFSLLPTMVLYGPARWKSAGGSVEAA